MYKLLTMCLILNHDARKHISTKIAITLLAISIPYICYSISITDKEITFIRNKYQEQFKKLAPFLDNATIRKHLSATTVHTLSFFDPIDPSIDQDLAKSIIFDIKYGYTLRKFFKKIIYPHDLDMKQIQLDGKSILYIQFKIFFIKLCANISIKLKTTIISPEELNSLQILAQKFQKAALDTDRLEHSSIISDAVCFLAVLDHLWNKYPSLISLEPELYQQYIILYNFLHEAAIF